MAEKNEVELKLEVEANAAALKDHPLLAGAAAEAKPQKSVYFDTARGALRKAGFSLRVRSSGSAFVQNVKQTKDKAAGMFDRPEWETEIDGPGIDFDALGGTPLAALMKPALRDALGPVITTEIVRTIWNLAAGGSRIELNLDEGMVASGARRQMLNELELELMDGDAAMLMDVARALGRTMPLRLGVMSKLERGFALADGSIDEVHKAEPIFVTPAMNVAESFVAIAHSCLRHFRLNEPLVAQRRDAGALHQARVAMRRLRSAFSLFGPATRDRECGRIREELRWFTGQLGDARNLDVLVKRFEADPEPRRRLERAREEAYDLVMEALNAQRFRDLMLDLLGWLEFGEWRSSRFAMAPIAPFARERIDSRWRKVKKAGRDLASLAEEPRHRLRIDIKKLRYALEFLSSLHKDQKPRQKAFVGALAEMQEELGYLNDITTARILLARINGDEDLIPAPAPEEEVSHLAAAQKGYAGLSGNDGFWR